MDFPGKFKYKNAKEYSSFLEYSYLHDYKFKYRLKSVHPAAIYDTAITWVYRIISKSSFETSNLNSFTYNSKNLRFDNEVSFDLIRNKSFSNSKDNWASRYRNFGADIDDKCEFFERGTLASFLNSNKNLSLRNYIGVDKDVTYTRNKGKAAIFTKMYNVNNQNTNKILEQGFKYCFKSFSAYEQMEFMCSRVNNFNSTELSSVEYERIKGESALIDSCLVQRDNGYCEVNKNHNVDRLLQGSTVLKWSPALKVINQALESDIVILDVAIKELGIPKAFLLKTSIKTMYENQDLVLRKGHLEAQSEYIQFYSKDILNSNFNFDTKALEKVNGASISDHKVVSTREALLNIYDFKRIDTKEADILLSSSNFYSKRTLDSFLNSTFIYTLNDKALDFRHDLWIESRSKGIISDGVFSFTKWDKGALADSYVILDKEKNDIKVENNCISTYKDKAILGTSKEIIGFNKEGYSFAESDYVSLYRQYKFRAYSADLISFNGISDDLTVTLGEYFSNKKKTMGSKDDTFSFEKINEYMNYQAQQGFKTISRNMFTSKAEVIERHNKTLNYFNQIIPLTTKYRSLGKVKDLEVVEKTIRNLRKVTKEIQFSSISRNLFYTSETSYESREKNLYYEYKSTLVDKEKINLFKYVDSVGVEKEFIDGSYNVNLIPCSKDKLNIQINDSVPLSLGYNDMDILQGLFVEMNSKDTGVAIIYNFTLNYKDTILNKMIEVKKDSELVTIFSDNFSSLKEKDVSRNEFVEVSKYKGQFEYGDFVLVQKDKAETEKEKLSFVQKEAIDTFKFNENFSSSKGSLDSVFSNDVLFEKYKSKFINTEKTFFVDSYKYAGINSYMEFTTKVLHSSSVESGLDMLSKVSYKAGESVENISIIKLEKMYEINEDMVKLKKDKNLREVMVEKHKEWVYSNFIKPPEILGSPLDELLLPGTDFKYEVFEDSIFDKENLKPINPIKVIDDNTFITDVPIKHPFKGCFEGQVEYIEVNVNEMRHLIEVAQSLWMKKAFKFGALDMKEALNVLIEDLYLYVKYSMGNSKAGRRVVKLFRWYGEACINKYANYRVTVEYKPLKSDLYLGECAIPHSFNNMYVDSNAYMISNNVMGQDSSVIFFSKIPCDTEFSFIANVTRGVAEVYIDSEKVDTLYTGTSKKKYQISKSDNPVTFKISYSGEHSGIISISSVEIKDALYSGLNVEYEAVVGAGNKFMDILIKYLTIYEDVLDGNKEYLEEVLKSNYTITTVFEKLYEYLELHHIGKVKGKRITMKK